MTPAVVLLIALVAEDPAVLRNAPRDNAPAQATLWRGDWLEVRGERAGFLEVYDHRHERPGYLRPSQVRTYRVDESSAPELASVVRFLREASGYESLGIGYAALALRAVPAGADTSELLASIGSMADRLARRASARRADAKDATLAAHVAVVAFAPGVHMPERVLGFTWTQIHLVLGFQATIMMLAFLIQSTTPLDKGIGLFLMLLAAIALLVGAVLRMQEQPSGSAPPAV